MHDICNTLKMQFMNCQLTLEYARVDLHLSCLMIVVQYGLGNCEARLSVVCWPSIR